MKTYGIIGTGAIGGYCAVKLHQAGFAVHCLMGSDYSHVKQHGLTLISKEEKITVPVNAYDDFRKMPVCDVILIALKTTSNLILKEVLSRFSQSTIVVLQNGIGSEQEIAEFFPADKIVGGSPMIKVTKETPGTITHYGLNSIELAQYFPDDYKKVITSQVQALAKNFKKAGIESIATEHLPTIRWKKLTGNIPISGLSVVLDAYTQELIADPQIFALLCAMTEEVIAAAKACGADIADSFYQFRLGVLESFKDMPKNYSSMKVDFDAKKPLELHAIYENAINLAKQHRFSMPLTEMLYQQLQFLNKNNLDKVH